MLNWMDSLKGRSMMRLASFTDEEMLNYSRQHKNCFNFDVDAYPDRATQSVQEHFEFDKNTLKVTIKESW